jgi:ACR3 family arsenite efflux pump ArsB/CBS domain-containing protein
MKKLSWLQKNLIFSIPLTMILALFYGYFSEVSYLKNLIIPLTFLMVLPMMITLPIRKVFEGGDMKVQFVTQFLNFAITPFIAFAIGLLFFSDNKYLALGLLLTGLLPTSGMTISWTGMAKGNMPAAIKMTIFGLLLGSLLTPIYINLLMGAEVQIEMAKIIQQIAIIIVIPLILGHLIQRTLIARYGMAHYQERLKSQFPPISTLGVLGIVFVAMALKAKTIFHDPMLLVDIFIPLFLLYLSNFVISTVVGKMFFKRGDAIALLYGSVMRNLSIALAIAMTAFGKEGADIALVISLGYVIQVQMGAWVVKFTDQIYGKAEAPTAEQFVHEGVFSLPQSSTLQEAIELLAEEKINSIAILNDAEKISGILTLKQAMDLIADNLPANTPLSTLTLSEPLLMDIKQPISAIAKEMKRTHNYKVLVTNQKGEVKGVISSVDILEFINNPTKKE